MLPMARDVVSISDSPKSWSFEPTGRLVHLRWAVAEITIGIETPSAALDAAERALRIFCQRATALLESLEVDSQGIEDARYTAELGVAEARSALAQSCQLRAERARSLHQARRKLHRALIVMAEALSREGAARCSSISGFHAAELSSLLALRQMFSAFRGALVSAGEQRSRLSWALEVVGLELSVLKANPMLTDLPLRSQQAIRELSTRVAAWGLKEPDPILGRSLYREACAVPTIGTELSLHPLLFEHDEQTLSELFALLSNEPSGSSLEHKVLGHLSDLRGLDNELDRLELNLIYGAPGVLGAMSLRVADLRSRLSRPSRAAASWS
jgi:hypothetical protein